MGGTPSKLNIPGAELCITSDEALELPDCPKKVRACVLACACVLGHLVRCQRTASWTEPLELPDCLKKVCCNLCISVCACSPIHAPLGDRHTASSARPRCPPLHWPSPTRLYKPLCCAVLCWAVSAYLTLRMTTVNVITSTESQAPYAASPASAPSSSPPPPLLPQIAVLGGGYIAVEFSSIFNRFGSEVHTVFRQPLPLRGFDEEVRGRGWGWGGGVG